MGRKGSQLIPFLIDALERKKYNNLRFEDPINRTFSLFLPQKSAKLDASCQLVLQGWYNVKGRPYRLARNYTAAKQCIEAALRKSDFLELVSKGKKQKLVYRILDQNEIQEKKNSKKEKKKALKLDPYEGSESAPSPESSGYGSGSDHAEEIYEWVENYNLLHGLNHDHKYIKKTEHVTVNDSLHQENVQSFDIANPTCRTEVLFHDSYTLIVEAPGINNLSPFSVEDVNMVTDQTPIGNKTQTYENSSSANMIETTELKKLLPLQLDGAKDLAPHVEKERFPKVPAFNYWESLAASRRTFVNPYGDLDLSRPPDNLFSDEGDNSMLQDTEDTEMLFDLPLDNNSPLSVVEIDEIFDFVMNSGKHSKNEEISTTTAPTNLDVSSYETKVVKVYECLHIQNLPEMIMLTCEPKLKEFCMTDATEIDESRPKLIFDEATMQLVSKCTIENLQFLSNDHLLVFLKCRVY